MDGKDFLSVLLPLFNEGQTVHELFESSAYFKLEHDKNVTFAMYLYRQHRTGLNGSKYIIQR
jgi:hypothetical protein